MKQSNNIVLVGAGKWGKQCAGVLSKFNNVVLKIADRTNWKSLIDEHPDGVVICTPPESHIEIATYSLDKNIPTMIEKPLALSYQEASQLLKYGDSVPILINNLHLFSPAFQQICQLVSSKDIVSISSYGTNTGPIRNYSSLFDYGPHDISMSLYLMKSMPIVDLISHQSSDDKELFEICLTYQPFIKHYMCIGNGSPIKQRYFEVVTQANDILIYDDLAKHKLIINNKIPVIESGTTLESSFNHFIKSLDGYQDDKFGVALSLQVLKILEECQKLIDTHMDKS